MGRTQKGCTVGFILLNAVVLWVLMWGVLSTSAFASESEICQPKLQKIQIAKGTGNSGEEQPLPEQWEEIAKVPDTWNTRWNNYSGTAWYRLTWSYLCLEKDMQPMMLAISSINMAGQVFVNDKIVWKSKSLHEPLSREWNNPRRWVLPIGVLVQGDNTVLVRVQGVTEVNPGIGQVDLGEYEAVKEIHDKNWFKLRGLYSYAICFELVLGIIASSVWLLRRKEKAFGWYAIASFFWVLYLSTKVITEPLWGLSTLNMARLEVYLLLCFTFLSCIYPWRFANTTFPRLEKLFAVIVVISLFLLFFTPDQNLELVLTVVSVIGVSTYVLNSLLYPFLAMRSRLMEAYLLAVIMWAVYVPVGLHDGYQVIKNSGDMWAVYISPITAVFLGCIFALRLTRSMSSVERFNDTLKTTVERVSSELRESLEKSHQLELENVKLQERIQLAHDLHDGLGGSLVRSMASVEHSEQNLSNPQFLSMLKNLRDDLRLIVDHGSSLGAKVPETPMLWIAPVRYRFNQLFDELDIGTNWVVPEQWGVPISVVDCMALQRVLEECLTNIMKHSGASKVCVELKMGSGQLSLVIQDNGVGFDVAAVSGSGLSVGLHSMNIRLEKVGATLELHSEHGCTRITVQKKY